MSILEICLNIAILCNENSEPRWGAAFYSFASKLHNGENENVKQEIRGVYKGAGSFNDLVLHKDGMPLITENSQLDKLRSLLFNILIQK